MRKVKFYNKELVDLLDMQAVGDLAQVSMHEIVKRLLFSGFKVMSGFGTTQTAVVSGAVTLGVSFGLIDGKLLDVDLAQSVNIISNTGTWGTGTPAHATLPRYSLVCIAHATKDGDPASKWFVNDTDPANISEYQTVVNTRTTDYYDIKVVHGTPASSPILPATPAGYYNVARVTVPANATTVLTANILSLVPAPITSVESLATAYSDHFTGGHDNRYFTETESDARFNRHAVASVKVGGVTINTTAIHDILELVAGTNITITPDAVNKKITITAEGLPLATKLGAELGSSNTTSMSPLRTKEAIDAQVLASYVRTPGYTATTGINTYVATLTPAPASYYEGMAIALKIGSQNTGASTLNVNALGAKALKKANGNPVVSGNLLAGSVYTVRYNGTDFIIQGIAGSEIVTSATEPVGLSTGDHWYKEV